MRNWDLFPATSRFLNDYPRPILLAVYLSHCGISMVMSSGIASTNHISLQEGDEQGAANFLVMQNNLLITSSEPA